MAFEFQRYPMEGDAIVVVFDICSSSDIIEELTLKDELRRFQAFLGNLKRHLGETQKAIRFDPYKFTGDGWILLFPVDTDGKALLAFLRDLCAYFKTEFKEVVLNYLDTPPAITGLTFGLDKGKLAKMTMFQNWEYIGRAINIACRLQSAVKDDGESPAYKALVSSAVFNEYFSKVEGCIVKEEKRKLRNIRGGAEFRVRKIKLI
jgi:hypothetical protein